MTGRNGWRVTFDVVTEESAEAGDVAESGFLDSRGWRVPAIIGAETPGVDMTLSEAMALVSPIEDCGAWWRDGGATDRIGDVESRSIHPPQSITCASYARVSRLLGVKR